MLGLLIINLTKELEKVNVGVEIANRQSNMDLNVIVE